MASNPRPRTFLSPSPQTTPRLPKPSAPNSNLPRRRTLPGPAPAPPPAATWPPRSSPGTTECEAASRYLNFHDTTRHYNHSYQCYHCPTIYYYLLYYQVF